MRLLFRSLRSVQRREWKKTILFLNSNVLLFTNLKLVDCVNPTNPSQVYMILNSTSTPWLSFHPFHHMQSQMSAEDFKYFSFRKHAQRPGETQFRQTSVTSEAAYELIQSHLTQKLHMKPTLCFFVRKKGLWCNSRERLQHILKFW